jgi:putative membrane protein
MLEPAEVPWQRQSPLLVVVQATEAIRQAFFQILVPMWFAFDSDMPGAMRLGLLVLAATPLLPVLWVWFVHRYRLQGDAIEVRTGLLVRKNTVLPLARVQAADRTAGILQRVFGLVRLQLSSGASGTQVDLKALTPPEAERLLAAVDAARRGVPLDAADDGIEDIAPPPAPERPSGPPLDLRRFVALGITSGRALAMLAAAFYLGDDLIEAFGGPEWADVVADQITNGRGEAAARAITVPFVISGALLAAGVLAFLSTLEVALRYGDFRVEAGDGELIVHRGLLERRSVTLRRDKLQAVRIVEPLLLSWLGYVAVDVEVIGHSGERGQSTRVHPALRHEELPAFLDAFLPGFAVRGSFAFPPQRARVRFWLRPAIVAVVATGFSAWLAVSTGVWFLALLALPTWPRLLLSGRAWRETGLALPGEHAILQWWRGWTRMRALVPRRRVQSAWASASFLQRRRDVASAALTVATGAGGKTFVVRDLDPADARRITQWLGRELAPAVSSSTTSSA